MTPLDRLPAPLRSLALARGGLVARRELLGAGWSTARADGLARAVLTVHPGVYDVTRTPDAVVPVELRHRAWAAHLFAGRDSVVAGPACLVLQGARGLDADVVDVHLTVPDRAAGARGMPRRVCAPGPGVRVRRRTVPRHTTVRDGLPLLTVEEAVLDLTTTPRSAVGLVTQVCQQRLTTPRRLREYLDERHRHPQRLLLEGLLDDVAAGGTSVLEVRFRRDVLARHGMPTGVGQLCVPGTGRRADIGYEQERLLVELDGIAFHSGSARFADLDRDNAHLVGGWVTMRFGWLQVTTQPCATAVRLRDALRARGGEPTFRPCPRC